MNELIDRINHYTIMDWIPVIIAILGVLPLFMVWLKRSLHKKFIARAEETTGMVESMEQRFGARGTRYYLATINYTANFERLRGFHVLPYSRRMTLVPGQQVAVLYDPNKPGKFTLKDFPPNFKVLWIIMGIMAIFFLWIAYFVHHELKGAYYAPEKVEKTGESVP